MRQYQIKEPRRNNESTYRRSRRNLMKGMLTEKSLSVTTAHEAYEINLNLRELLISPSGKRGSYRTEKINQEFRERLRRTMSKILDVLESEYDIKEVRSSAMARVQSKTGQGYNNKMERVADE